MSGALRHIGLLAGFCLSCAGIPDPPSLSSSSEPNEIKGVVHRVGQTAGIEGAIVLLTCTCLPEIMETNTNPDGVFRFKALQPGKYTVQVLYKDELVSRIVELTPDQAVRIDVWMSGEMLMRG